MANNYEQKYKQRRAEIEGIKESFRVEATLKDIITIRPSAELATIEHYSSIPGVEFDSDVSTFWNEQQKRFNDIKSKMEAPKNKYLNAYNRMKDIEDNIEASIKRQTGLNDPDKKIKELKHEKSKILKQEVWRIQDNVNPGMLLLEKFTGCSIEETKKFQAPLDHLNSINKQIKEAKARKEQLIESQEKLEAKKEMARLDMLEALEELDKEKYKAQQINEQSIQKHQVLEQQYKIVDMYVSLQKFKSGGEYSTIRTVLETQDPQLVQDMDNIPDTLPQGIMKISLSNPLSLSNLPIDHDKITKIDEKINQIKGKLPTGIDMDNISGEIQSYSLTSKELEEPGAALSKFENEKSNLDNMGYSPEEKAKKEQQLDMKIEHLKREAIILNAKNDIKKTVEEINKMSPTNPDLKNKYAELEAKKARLQLLQEEQKSDDYSQTINNLQEIEKLMAEKEKASQPLGLTKLGQVTESLEQSQLLATTGTISAIYTAIKNSIEAKKQRKIEEIERKKNPELEQQNDGKVPPPLPVREDDDGR